MLDELFRGAPDRPQPVCGMPLARDPAQHAGTRRAALASLGRIAFSALALAGSATRAGRSVASAADDLPRPAGWRTLLRDAAADGHPVVVLFSTPGCAFCRFVRRDHLRHLAASVPHSGVRVVELSLADRHPFASDDDGTSGRSAGSASPGTGLPLTPPGSPAVPEPESPAALAAALGIRFAPTVAFFGPQGELAARLVGYASADFYGAYLDERIATASAALREARASSPARHRTEGS